MVMFVASRAETHICSFVCSGACVRLAEEQKIGIDTLTLEQLQSIDSRFEADVADVWDYEVSVERKSSIGGTAKASVVKQIDDIISFANTLA
jgi:argininosuccinate lyase